jgi:antitoxin PrlF
MKKQAKVTSKGQITIPREVRRRLGVRAGDRVVFEERKDGMRISAVREESPFEKYRGIGTPGIGRGRKGIEKWMRELRGHGDDE